MVTEAVEDVPAMTVRPGPCECERPEDVFAMEVVASLQGPPSPRPGVAAAVGDDDVPVVT